MKTTKKLIALTLALTLVVVLMVATLAACSGGDTPSGDTPSGDNPGGNRDNGGQDPGANNPVQPGADDYTPYNARWVDEERGIIAFDFVKALDVDGSYYLVTVFENGISWGNLNVLGDSQNMTVEADISQYMQSPGSSYHFEVYAAYIPDGQNYPEALGGSRWATSPQILWEGRPETPVDPNERGNITSNTINGGYVAEKDGWVYYRERDNFNLIKARPDGTERTVLIDRESNNNRGVGGGINVVGDWVYFKGDYSGLYKIRTDGTSDSRWPTGTIVEAWIMGSVSNMTVVGEWIYYVQDSATDVAAGLYKVSTQFSHEPEQILLAEGYVRSVNVVDGWIYYVGEHDGEWQTLCKMRTDGTEHSVIEPDFILAADDPNNWGGIEQPLTSSHISEVIVQGAFLFCRSNFGSFSGIYRMDLNGKDAIQIVEANQIYYAAIGDGHVYFSAIAPESPIRHILFRANLDGSDVVEIASQSNQYYDLHVTDGWVYYNATDPDTYQQGLYRIRTDGSDEQVVR